jgi:hypothetical protein
MPVKKFSDKEARESPFALAPVPRAGWPGGLFLLESGRFKELAFQYPADLNRRINGCRLIFWKQDDAPSPGQGQEHD